MLKASFNPAEMLKQYEVYLNDSGGIDTDADVTRLVELMETSDVKLLPKCIALCVIDSSISDVQCAICKTKAWDILLKWLQQALKDEDDAFLLEILGVYWRLPVSLSLLTQNVCPKVINSLSKKDHNREGIKDLAVKIVSKWKSVISSAPKKSEALPLGKRPESIKAPEEDPKEDLSKLEKKRRRTVKMPPTVMRTAGVEDNPVQLHPKPRLEAIAKRKLENDSDSTETSIESFHQKINMSPSEPKKIELHESLNFINALTTTPTTAPLIKKKRKLSNSNHPVTNSSKPADSPTSDSTVKDDSLNFEAITSSPMTEPTLDTSISHLVADGTKKSNLSSVSSSFVHEDKPKKRVSWATDDKLTSYHYFELDSSERVNVNRLSADELRRKDSSMDRPQLKRSYDSDISSQKWYTPKLLVRDTLTEPGCNSLERDIQRERERDVLQAIYFTRDSIPPSADEPDQETVERQDPIEIPTDDLTKQAGEPEPNNLLLVNQGGVGDKQVSLNPEVANLLKSMAANFTSSSETTNSVPSLLTTPVTAPEPVALPPPTTAIPSLVTSSSQPEPLTTPTPEVVEKAPVSAPEPSAKQNLQKELWDVLEENYPELNVRELNAERIRELLEPLRGQLFARGIVQMPTPPPPSIVNEGRPPMFGPPGGQMYVGPPPAMGGLPIGAYPRHPSMHPMHPNEAYGPPLPRPLPFNAAYPGPPHFSRGGPPPRGGPRPRSGPRGPRSQPCRYFLNGHCRNGPLCTFSHTS